MRFLVSFSGSPADSTFEKLFDRLQLKDLLICDLKEICNFIGQRQKCLCFVFSIIFTWQATFAKVYKSIVLEVQNKNKAKQKRN